MKILFEGKIVDDVLQIRICKLKNKYKVIWDYYGMGDFRICKKVDVFHRGNQIEYFDNFHDLFLYLSKEIIDSTSNKHLEINLENFRKVFKNNEFNIDLDNIIKDNKI